jgi:DNA invertase Pin-like site-specific DNA recombinase
MVIGKAGCLLRVSTDEQERKKLSLELQEEVTAIACQKLGFIPVVYNEGAVSSRSLDRPEQKRALDDLAAGRIKAIVLVELSRLGRPGRVTDVAEIVDFLHKVGGKVVECGRNKFEAERAALLDLAVRGDYERVRDKLISAGDERERTYGRAVEGMLRMEAEGRPRVLKPPYWAKIHGRSARAYVELIPERVATIQAMAEHFLRCQSFSKTAAWMNQQPNLTKRICGKPWIHSSVSFMLKNPHLAGYEQYRRKRYVSIYSGNNMEQAMKERGLKTGESPLIESDFWPEVLSKPIWHEIQAVMAKISSETAQFPRVYQDKWPLSSILRCVNCGGPLYSSRTSRQKSPVRKNYRCMNEGCTKHQSIEANVCHKIAHMIGLQYIEQWKDRPKLTHEPDLKRAELNQKHSQLEAQRRVIFNDWAGLGIRPEEVGELLRNNLAQIEAVVAELENLPKITKTDGDFLPLWAELDLDNWTDLETCFRLTFSQLTIIRPKNNHYELVKVVMSWGEEFSTELVYRHKRRFSQYTHKNRATT